MFIKQTKKKKVVNYMLQLTYDFFRKNTKISTDFFISFICTFITYCRILSFDVVFPNIGAFNNFSYSSIFNKVLFNLCFANFSNFNYFFYFSFQKEISYLVEFNINNNLWNNNLFFKHFIKFIFSYLYF